MFIHPFTQNFDSLFDELTSSAYKEAPAYPPYSIGTIEKDDKTYGLIEIAATGLSQDNIKVFFDDESRLVVEGKYPENKVDISYSHKGLSTKDFVRRFRIEKNFEVKEVILKDGLLRIFLEENKPQVQYLPINKKSKNILVA